MNGIAGAMRRQVVTSTSHSVAKAAFIVSRVAALVPQKRARVSLTYQFDTSSVTKSLILRIA